LPLRRLIISKVIIFPEAFEAPAVKRETEEEWDKRNGVTTVGKNRMALYSRCQLLAKAAIPASQVAS
jgi:hypothetical protein